MSLREYASLQRGTGGLPARGVSGGGTEDAEDAVSSPAAKKARQGDLLAARVTNDGENKDADDSGICLLCYDSEGADQVPCCNKEVCGRCLRLLRRRSFQPELLCPFCRRPWGESAAGAGISSAVAAVLAVRGGVVAELRASRSSADAVRRISILLLLAPSLAPALEAVAEALVDVIAATSQKQIADAASVVAAGLCREWPAAGHNFLAALRRFWEDLGFAGGLSPSAVDRPGGHIPPCPVAGLYAWLVKAGELQLAQVLTPLRLQHQATLPAQARFVCSLLSQLEDAMGRDKLRASLFQSEAADVLDDADDEGELRSGLGIFPTDGHPSNVRFVRGLFEGAGLAWLCEHESFSPLAMLSDDEGDAL